MLQLQESSKCHVNARWWQLRFLQWSSNICFNRCSQVHVEDESYKHKHEGWWILMNKSEKSVWEIERIWWFFCLDLKKWLWLSEFSYD
jgi:hypothetical protein